MYQLLLIFFLALSFLTEDKSFAAAPEISLSARLVNDSSTLAVSISPSASTAGCAYTLFGSAKSTVFGAGGSGGRNLVTFPASSDVSKRRAKNLRLIQRSGSSRPKAYFRTLLTCASETSLSNVFALSLKTGRRGVSGTGAWLRELVGKFRTISVQLVSAFPNLSFSSPLALVSPADGTRRLFVVEQGGKIYVFTNSAAVQTKSLFLDLSSRISQGGELGLLGLAFHPQFAQNGKFYVNYTELRSQGSALSRSVIAGYTLTSANVADPASEQRLIVLNQPFDNHNGGDLAFGPDGYLYIGFGDGGSGGDPQGNGQDRTTLLGKILRIDVDHQEGQLTYAIPASNPYRGNQSGFREEIFAYGLRNPFRFSFDAPSGRLYVGDVGQGEVEEIDIITSGANYGWNTMEGSQCYPSNATCSSAGLTLPITEYDHSVGQSIIGGYIYNGRAVPNLKGHYVFGDFVSGVIFSLIYDGATATRRTLLSSGLSISSFGRDENGEVYVVSYGDGKIYKVAAQ